MRARGLFALFALGAVGGLIGDMCHVTSGTTAYLEDPLPYIWESQLWFPLMVGVGTTALGAVAAGFRSFDVGADAVEIVSMIASVVGLYAVTALIIDLPDAAGVVLVYAIAALVCARFARSRADLLCGALAAGVGVGTEIVLDAAAVFTYGDGVPQILGVASWLPGLYLAYGVVAARLGSALAAGGGAAPEIRRT